MTPNVATPAAVRLALLYPFWTEVFYSMTVYEASPEQIAQGLETQATDGRDLWINVDFFKSIPLAQQVVELVHELGHKIFLHPTRRGSREPKLWNIACDHAINTLMKKNGFVIPPDWLCDMKYAGWLAEAIYADLKKEENEREKNGGGPGPQLPKGRQDIKEPSDNGQPLSPEQTKAFEDKVKAMVDRAIANAKAMGTLPAGMEQGTVVTYQPAREPWYNHLHRYMQALRPSHYDWARINRRAMITHGVFAPLHYSEVLGDIAVFIDTSGSCVAKAQQARFAAHLNAILAEAKPQHVHVYYFDAQVYPGEVIEPGELDVVTRPRGGGGTSFVPIFEQLDEEGIVPDVCIILTDLDGRFPAQEPAYPVMWADVWGRKRAPFGEVIRVVD